MKKIVIAQNLKNLLHKHDITNIELANYLGVSSSTVSSYVTKDVHPPIRKILEICDYFKISIEELLFENSQGIKFIVEEPKLEYNSIRENVSICLLTGGECHFREIDNLRKENEALKKEIKKSNTRY